MEEERYANIRKTVVKDSDLLSFVAILVVTTGLDHGNQFLTKTEVIDVKNPSLNCTPWADSYSVERAVGGFIDNSLVICSGTIPSGPRGPPKVISTNKCFIVNQTDAYPHPFDLQIASEASSAVMADRGRIFITGGKKGKIRVITPC